MSLAEACQKLTGAAHSIADLLVEFEPGNDLPFLQRYFGLREALSHLLGRPVDLIEPSASHVPDFRDSIAFRNLLIHGYAVINHDEVWDAV